ncbi:MAG TPA: hypothetical protein DDW49_01860 [Deltaproteobacteria bacterium]|nr:MAG: hypothetical protein A2048_10030 [Deltaproteobacteria bacterium GWA2_45_12]HBF12129.1 hypothetical protein [Deltaproteobacteria bacterium]
MTWYSFVPDFILKQWDKWFQKAEGSLIYFSPSYISKKNNLFSPLIAIIAIISSIVLIGVAIGSCFTLLASLLVLYFILTKIFGIRLDMGDTFVV